MDTSESVVVFVRTRCRSNCARMRYFLVLALALAAACFRPTLPEVSLNGTWTLVSMDGKPLPYLANPVTGRKVAGGALFFYDDGTMQAATRYSDPDNLLFDTVMFTAGTYVLRGSRLTVHLSGDFYPVAGVGETALDMPGDAISSRASGVTALYVQQ